MKDVFEYRKSKVTSFTDERDERALENIWMHYFNQKVMVGQTIGIDELLMFWYCLCMAQVF